MKREKERDRKSTPKMWAFAFLGGFGLVVC